MTKKVKQGWYFDKAGNIKFTTIKPTATKTGKLADSVGFPGKKAA